MHTEQDTFDRLRRIPFEEMRLIVRKIHSDIGKYNIALQALRTNGWTQNDYSNQLVIAVQKEHEKATKDRLEAGQ